ncbi:MAG TPA: aminotransferase class I/II-fold pyridoxal phosphate-dependent enzyme [Candidatus Dormibacteraeota bacterium]|nr:aminotransferase class I/II-fold pyridoxal phosphate-dependent enzyme [Candidatus Dormibacteraeota bacterium]
MAKVMSDVDRFGNQYAPGLPYARGRILSTTADDFTKLKRAWRVIQRRGVDNVYIFSGLEHGLPLEQEDLPALSDEIGPALYFERMREKALEHLGGDPAVHDVAVFNRLTGATIATALVLVKPGDVVLGVSASHSHPSVSRAVRYAGGTLIDVSGADAFEAELARNQRTSLVILTRLAVTYELLPLKDIERIVSAAHARGIPVYMDDAGGARIGPAIFGQPRMLELGVDVGATGLDKYGTSGPRLGVLAGSRELVSKIRARGFEMASEARPLLYPAVFRSLERYRPERVRALVDCTKEVAVHLKGIFGSRVYETPVTAQLLAEDILDLALERAGAKAAPIVPYEATAALCMLLLERFGVYTVHFVGVPPGTGDLLIKFIPPETLARFGGAEKFAQAIDGALDELAKIITQEDRVRELLLGPA